MSTFHIARSFARTEYGCRLTLSTPFGEEDTTTDVKIRVRNRRVEWHLLRERCTNPVGESLPRAGPLSHTDSPAAEDFLRGLLEYDPRKRMSLADARLHPWLAEQHAAAPPAPAPAALPAHPAPANLPAHPRRTASLEPDHPIDASLRSIALDGMALDDSMDAEPDEPESGRSTPEYVPEDEDSQSQSQANGRFGLPISRQQSRLRRRVDIIRSAENRGEELPSPSQEMRQRAAAEDAEENGAGPSRKRKAAAALDFESSLTPMEEEEDEEEEEEEEPVAAPRGRGAPANKRGRGGRKTTAPPPSAVKRGRGRAAAPVLAIAAAPASGDDGEAGGRRRSTRLHQASPAKQKVARRG